MVARLKAARLSDSDLLSSFDNALGDLERNLCEIFGFTLDEDITESPITFSNAGVVTKSILKRYVPGDTAQNSAISFTLTDTGGGGVGFNRYIVPAAGTLSNPAFYFALNSTYATLDMSTGGWYTSGRIDAVSKQLIPATARLTNLFFCADGSWATPGVIPYAGCILEPVKTTIAAATDDSQQWSEVVDVGGYFTSVAPTVVTIPSGGDGKYIVDVNLAGNIANGATFLDVTGLISKNGTSTYCTFHDYTTSLGPNTPHHGRLITTMDLVAGDTIEVEIFNDSDATVYFGEDSLSEAGSTFDGRMSVFRIE